MPTLQYFPHIDVLLSALRINKERLNSKSKIAIEARLLRMLLQTVVEKLPFSEPFYKATYPDLADAFKAGTIPDLHRHYVESGFFEGRFGAPPQVDEPFYSTTYADVADAVQRGIVVSGEEHYMRSGAAEGRSPNADVRNDVETWMSVLRDDVVRTGP